MLRRAKDAFNKEKEVFTKLLKQITSKERIFVVKKSEIPGQKEDSHDFQKDQEKEKAQM